MRDISDVLPDEFEESYAIVRNARKKLSISVESAVPFVAQVRTPIAKAPKEKLAV